MRCLYQSMGSKMSSFLEEEVERSSPRSHHLLEYTDAELHTSEGAVTGYGRYMDWLRELQQARCRDWQQVLCKDWPGPRLAWAAERRYSEWQCCCKHQG